MSCPLATEKMAHAKIGMPRDLVLVGGAVDDHPQPEGSHVYWPTGVVAGDDEDEVGRSLHRMKGKRRGASSSWDVRFPHDRFVRDTGVTLEEMREQGAL